MNADVPTYGWRDAGGKLVTSATACAIRVASLSRPCGSTRRSSLSSRLATTETRSALPVRSPYPLMVPCTWVAPASTAARVLATAQPVSLWQWMPTRTPVDSTTSLTTSPTQPGSIPPLVSHSAITEAPASYAVRSTSSA